MKQTRRVMGNGGWGREAIQSMDTGVAPGAMAYGGRHPDLGTCRLLLSTNNPPPVLRSLDYELDDGLIAA